MRESHESIGKESLGPEGPEPIDILKIIKTSRSEQFTNTEQREIILQMYN